MKIDSSYAYGDHTYKNVTQHEPKSEHSKKGFMGKVVSFVQHIPEWVVSASRSLKDSNSQLSFIKSTSIDKEDKISHQVKQNLNLRDSSSQNIGQLEVSSIADFDEMKIDALSDFAHCFEMCNSGQKSDVTDTNQYHIDRLSERYPKIKSSLIIASIKLWESAQKSPNDSVKALSIDEFCALRIYSSGNYKEINRALREEVGLEHWKNLISDAESGIRKLARLSDEKNNYSVVFRGFNASEGMSYHPNNYIEGDILKDRAFVSSSASKSQAEYFTFGDNDSVMARIYSERGAGIESISRNPEEREFLFKPSTEFSLILKVYDSKNKTFQLVLEDSDAPIGKGSKGDADALIDKPITSHKGAVESESLSSSLDLEPIKLPPSSIFRSMGTTPLVTILDKAEDASNWIEIAGQKGSNPGHLMRDLDGCKWYVKQSLKGPDRILNEILACKLYEAAGVSVPAVKLVKEGDEYAIASQWIDGIKSDKHGMSKEPQAMEGFAVDAWLANWDVVGLDYDNLVRSSDGNILRLDVGGSLLYRAQGEPKGHKFGGSVGELKTLLDGTNPQSAHVFRSITQQQLDKGIQRIASIDDKTIDKIVKEFGPGEVEEKDTLANILKERRDYLINFDTASLGLKSL